MWELPRKITNIKIPVEIKTILQICYSKKCEQHGAYLSQAHLHNHNIKQFDIVEETTKYQIYSNRRKIKMFLKGIVRLLRKLK